MGPFALPLVIAVLDLAFPDVAFLTFLAVPSVASIALGRVWLTVSLSVLAGVLFVVLSLGDVGDASLVWRRAAVLAATCVLSVVMAWVVQRGNARLERQSALYRLVAENSTDVVFRGSNEGVLEWTSAESAGRDRWAPERMIGRPFLEFVHPEDVPTVRGTQKAVLAGESRSMQIRIRTADDRFRWTYVTVKPQFDRSGQVIGRVGGWTDVQDLVEAQETAERRRAEAHSIFESQIDPFIQFSPIRDESGTIVDLRIEEANPAAFFGKAAPLPDPLRR